MHSETCQILYRRQFPISKTELSSQRTKSLTIQAQLFDQNKFYLLMQYQQRSQKLPTIFGIPLEPWNLIEEEGQEGAIFLGDIQTAQDLNFLRNNNIKAVLTVAKNSNLSYNKNDIKFHEILQAQDQDNFDLYPFFERAYQFIDSVRKRTNVLIHCFAGVSRSAAIVIAYFMKKKNWLTDKAYKVVKSKRRLTCPNIGFCYQLKKYEKFLMGQNFVQSANSSRIYYTDLKYKQNQQIDEDRRPLMTQHVDEFHSSNRNLNHHYNNRNYLSNSKPELRKSLPRNYKPVTFGHYSRPYNYRRPKAEKAVPASSRSILKQNNFNDVETEPHPYYPQKNMFRKQQMYY